MNFNSIEVLMKSNHLAVAVAAPRIARFRYTIFDVRKVDERFLQHTIGDRHPAFAVGGVGVKRKKSFEGNSVFGQLLQFLGVIFPSTFRWSSILSTLVFL